MESNNRRKATQTKNILIRCSPEQHEKIFTNASLNKLNVSQYILKKTLDEKIRFESNDESNIKTNCEFISNLIFLKNDLARLGNLFKLYIDNGNTSSDSYKKIFNEFDELKSKINNFLGKVLK